jgi:hypothetical protein
VTEFAFKSKVDAKARLETALNPSWWSIAYRNTDFASLVMPLKDGGGAKVLPNACMLIGQPATEFAFKSKVDAKARLETALNPSWWSIAHRNTDFASLVMPLKDGGGAKALPNACMLIGQPATEFEFCHNETKQSCVENRFKQ